MFFPTNEAILAAKDAGMIPEVVDGDVTELRKYLQYYFVPLKKNKLNFYLLPGLGPEGATTEAYSGRYVTLSEYQNETDAKTMGIAWNPDVPESLTITDMAGNTITTEPGVIYRVPTARPTPSIRVSIIVRCTEIKAESKSKLHTSG